MSIKEDKLAAKDFVKGDAISEEFPFTRFVEEVMSRYFFPWIACTYMIFILICCGDNNYYSGGDFGSHVNVGFLMADYLYLAFTVIMIPIGIFDGLCYLCSEHISIFSKIFWTLWTLCTLIALVLTHIQSTLDSQSYMPFVFFSAVFMACIILQAIVRRLFCRFCHIDD